MYVLVQNALQTHLHPVLALHRLQAIDRLLQAVGLENHNVPKLPESYLARTDLLYADQQQEHSTLLRVHLQPLRDLNAHE